METESADSRASKPVANVEQSRPSLSREAPGALCKRHFRPLRPTVSGGAVAGARFIRVTSCGSSSDHGNMALNGSGEVLDCLGHGRGMRETGLSALTPSPGASFL